MTSPHSRAAAPDQGPPPTKNAEASERNSDRANTTAGVSAFETTLAGAPECARRGFRVFPVEAPVPGDPRTGKAPAELAPGHPFRFTRDSTTDPDVIRAWDLDGRGLNYGVYAAGSDLLILDEDVPGAVDAWAAHLGITFPPTFTVETGRGRHLYFRAGGVAFPQRDAWPGVNVRHRGYVVGPGSVHAETGAVYTITDDRDPAPLPAVAAEALTAEGDRPGPTTGPVPESGESAEAAAHVARTVPRVLDDLREVAGLAPGERNARGQGWEQQSGIAHGASALVELANTAPGTYPIDQAEADFMLTAPPGEHGRWARKWGWAMGQAADKKRAVTDPAGVFAPLGDWGDAELRGHMRMAARFKSRAADKCRFVVGSGWHRWDGRRWAPDAMDSHAHAILTAVLKESWAEAVRDRDLQADVKGSMNQPDKTLKIAARMPGLLAEEVDQDAYLLNCWNGTLDLRTGRLRPADPADLITKVTRASYEPGPAGAWAGFLEEVLPDPEVRAYLARYVGVALVGRVIEHVLMIAVGAGRNGKSVLASAIHRALGDYAITATNDLLTVGRHGGRSPGELSAQMQLRGARWADMSELNVDDRLASATMKTLTGGDPITAKHMGQDWTVFTPSHSLFMLTNYLPRVPASDSAAWARIQVVPFEVSFQGREDKHLTERLTLAMDEVLAWAVAGYADYKRHGERLDEPASVLDAKGRYRAENDLVRMFITECCETSPDAWTPSSEFLSAFNAWARLQNEKQWTPKAMAERLRSLPGVHEQKKHGGTRGWAGVAVLMDL